MSKVTVFDLETQSWVTVDDQVASAGVASGKYEPGAQNVRTDKGEMATRSFGDLTESEAVGDTADTARAVAEAAMADAAARREAYDTVGDKVLTLSEGVVDAMSVGLLHEHGEGADIRRDVNSGSALVGQLLGTAAGMGFGPVRAIAGGASKAGKAAAGAILGEAAEARVAGKIASRAIEEAAVGGALMGSTAFGHQVSDAIIEDKVFAGEAVLHEMGLGAALGFGAGALSGGFSAAASRGAIKAQGGLVDGASTSSRALVDEVKGVHQAWKDAAYQYEARAGVLEKLHQKGVIPEEMVVPYRDAAKAARRAVDQLDNFSVAQVLDASPKEYQKFRKVMEQARVAVDDAGGVFMSPPSAARPQRLPVSPGRAVEQPKTGVWEGGDDWSQGLDDLMMRDPEALAAYERLHGRPYEPIQRPKIEGEGGIEMERFVDDAAAPTDRTAAGGRKGKNPIEQLASDVPQEAVKGKINRVNGGVTGAFERGELRTNVKNRPIVADDAIPPSGEYTQVTPEGIPTRQVAQPQGWQPKTPKGRFSLDDFSEDTLAGEGVGFRELNRQVDKGDFLNNAHGQRDLGLFPDGYMAPAKDIEANARAFADFRQRAAGDTISQQALPAAEAAPGPATVRDWNVARGDGNKTIRDAAVPRGEPPIAEDLRTIRDHNVPRGEPRVADDLERTYKDPNVPRGEPLPKSEGEIPDDVTGVWGAAEADAKTQVRPKKGSPEWEEFERRAAEDYVEKWYWESKAQGPRISPADEAAVRIDQAMKQLSDLSGGRLNSAGALEIGERLGLRPTSDMFVDRLDQVWSLRKAAKFAADEARGVATPLRGQGQGLVDEMAKRFAARQGAVLGMAVGGPVGGAIGWVLGKHAPNALGFGAKAASSAGKIMNMAVKTGESLLRGRRATLVTRAIAGNRPYAYDHEGPISDPVKRIEKIHQVAANPDQVRATVRNQLGDVALQSPELAHAYEEAAVRQVTNLSLQAPVIMRDAIGRTVMPTAGALRKFYEFENSTHDLPGLLGSIERGAITPTMALALAQQHVAVHGAVVKTLLSDPDVLAHRTTAELRAMEMVLQIPLTRSAVDPASVARTQASWAAPVQQAPQQTPQAFKITPPAPTPSQSGPVAPGNQ